MPVTTADLSGDEIPKRLKVGKNPMDFLKKDKYSNANKEMKFDKDEEDKKRKKKVLKKIRSKIKKK
ncbi:MAG: hypothetical protein R6V59_02275 [Dehalococcoidia bacterium]